MEYIKFEQKVIELIDNYGAPENISEVIKDFLFQSNAIYDIIELVKEFEVN